MTVASAFAATALALTVGAIAAPTATADQLVTAQSLQSVTGYATPNGSGAGYEMAQTFLAEVSGPLTSVVLNLSQAGGPNAAVTIAITETSGGSPSGTVLASTTLAVADVTATPTALTEILFANPATVTAGTTYAITVTSTTTSGAYWVGGGTNDYAGGRGLNRAFGGAWLTSASTDYYFIAYVNTGSGDGNAPPDILEQFGLPTSGTCTAVPEDVHLNIANRTSGWGQSWTDASWLNNGAGGAVCVRTLRYSATLHDFAPVT